ncbi:MAG TPA: N-acetylmuramoyl-L-alanine amidase [Lachnospiraceae bacterium]|nr:N-acetylmuramoyl-L-alanine amidase [Lachnospiraceae bacterium]
MKRRIQFCLMTIISIILLAIFPIFEVNAASFDYPLDSDGKLVIVIDPGHGGDNLGADYNGYLEKEMNIAVANAMCDELKKYDDITVYQTHMSVEDEMTIKERADFAASVNADFLFCLHFNMSPDNKLFGSEVWVSAFGEENREGYRFGSIQMSTMKDMGLFIRGVKTKLNDSGTDYYGILRYCQEYDIPSALIEHCHVDHENDTLFCDSDEDIISFGIADATSVAKYFGLKSTELNVDYSDCSERIILPPGTLYVQTDTTDPDVCIIEEEYVDMEHHKIGILVTAHDYDTPMLYYAYSIDGGITYTPYIAWPDTDVMKGYSPDSFTLDINIPEGVTPSIVVKGINLYDRYTESNMLSGYSVWISTPAEVFETTEEQSVLSQDVSGNDDFNRYQAPQEASSIEKDRTFIYFLQLSLIVAILVFVCLFITNLILSSGRHHKKKKNKRK